MVCLRKLLLVFGTSFHLKMVLSLVWVFLKGSIVDGLAYITRNLQMFETLQIHVSELFIIMCIDALFCIAGQVLICIKALHKFVVEVWLQNLGWNSGV